LGLHARMHVMFALNAPAVVEDHARREVAVDRLLHAHLRGLRARREAHLHADEIVGAKLPQRDAGALNCVSVVDVELRGRRELRHGLRVRRSVVEDGRESIDVVAVDHGHGITCSAAILATDSALSWSSIGSTTLAAPVNTMNVAPESAPPFTGS